MVKVLTIDVTPKGNISLGIQTYQLLPRAGEWLILTNEMDQQVTYEVLKVVHSPSPMGIDLYVKKVEKPMMALGLPRG